MTDHLLDGDADESGYFARQNKNGKAAYRRAVYTLTGDLPIWAKGLRKVYTQSNPKVYTQAAEVVTEVDPLTLIDPLTGLLS